MSTLGYILIFTFIGSLGSLIGGVILLSREKFAMKISHLLSSFAAGTLLATGIMHLLPEALHEAEKTGTDVFVWVIFGILLFFFIEQFLHWFHHHTYHHSKLDQSDLSKNKKIPLIIIGDTLHNFIDGTVIAGSFLVNIPLGITTALSVATHEIPQEIGDFGLMVHSGLKKSRILWINIGSAVAAFLGAIITYVIGDAIEGFHPIMLSLTSGFFIYLALADIVPEIHKEDNKRTMIYHSLLMILGIITVYLSGIFLQIHS